MTLLYMDGFDHYQTSELAEKGYNPVLSANYDVVPAAGRRGGKALKNGDINLSYVSQNFVSSDTVVVGAALSLGSAPSSFDLGVLVLEDAIGGLHSFEITTLGEYKLSSGGATATSSPGAWAISAYNYYELKFVKGTGADAVLELRKDGIVQLTINTSTGVDQIAGCRFLEGNSLTLTVMYMDDLYVLNGLGSTNNDYLGDSRVDTHLPASDGADSDFVPNLGGSNYTMVDEANPDYDSTFVQSGTVSERDLYTMPTTGLGTAIYGVQQSAFIKKTDAGTVTVDVVTEKPAGSGEKVGDNRTASDTYSYHIALLETDPDDSTTWSDAKIDATEFGYKVNNIVT